MGNSVMAVTAAFPRSGNLGVTDKGESVMKKFFIVMALGFVFATGFGLTVVAVTQPAMADDGGGGGGH
jgi:hypothetical protein